MKRKALVLPVLLFLAAAVASVNLDVAGYPAASAVRSADALTPLDPVTWGADAPASKPAQTTVGPGLSRERVHIKFREGTGIRLRGGEFVGGPGRDLPGVASVLAGYPGVRIQRLFSRPEATLAADQARLEARTGKDLPDLNLWYRLILPTGEDIEALVDSLNALDFVEIAYPEPLPAPPPSPPSPSPLYEDQQGYLDPAPGGIDARAAWTVTAGSGSNVKVVDIEYSWNVAHEDLSKAPGALIPNDTPEDPYNDDQHGTAVLGELVADSNAFGVTGIIYDADLGMVNAYNEEDYYDLADAIDLARANTAPGDIILIEQQTYGPVGDWCSEPDPYQYVPVEYWQGYFDAIQTATADGRIVVEAAGNGGCDLDNAAYGGLFNRAVRDSGAIIVGAGAGTGAGCTSPARSRLYFSCYGSRLDVQGWGECVVTTGYGDLYDTDPDEYYTALFSGTSSASPIVAGAAGSIQSACFASTGSVLAPATIRQLLVYTGTPQDMSVAGHIGPLPDLAAALRICTDTTDTDSDGCADVEEEARFDDGLSPLLPGETGGFNPNAWYDFYDVPVPAYADPTPNGPRNQAIAMDDVLAVLLYVPSAPSGTCGDDPNGNGVDYDCDKNVDTVKDGQDYDRTPGPGPSPPWDVGPPNDAIAMDDVLAVLAQTSLSCIDPP